MNIKTLILLWNFLFGLINFVNLSTMFFINPLNPTGRYSGLFYLCIYPRGRYSGLSICRHNPTGLYSGQMAKTSYGEILRVESFNGYCMVVYLYIYIALHAVHINQKRFQCKRPREKIAVLRERKEVLGSPVIVKWIA